MDLRNSNGIGLRSFYFTTVQKLISKIFTRSGKMHHMGINLGTSKSSKSKIVLYVDIDLRESHAKLHKKPSETLGADSILRLEISIYCLPRSFNGFPPYFAQSSFTEMKSAFIKLQNEPLPKAIGQ